jgi:hypothetical protein
MSRPTYQEEMLARYRVWDIAAQNLQENLQAAIAEASWLSADERARAQAILAELAESKFWASDPGDYPPLYAQLTA